MVRNYLIFILVICSYLFFLSCEKDIATYAPIDVYSFSGLDENGGSWKPILVTNEVEIPQPFAVTSTEYIAELNDVKSIITKASSEDLVLAKYWSQNPIIRWNEIACEMAAKYNLPPPPNADGTYTQPNPANPGQYPNFPFSHPPYASRAFAYLSSASFDAMIITWRKKYAYSRPAIHLTDPSISTVFLKEVLPSYPADGAAIATVAVEILSVMFPLEKDILEKYKIEAFHSLKVAGINVQSDIQAGDIIGKSVAAQYINRSKADGMKNAQVSKAVADSIRLVAKTKYGWEWVNMESPQRPVGIAPFYGKVKPWNVVDVAAIRPPAVGSADYTKAADELISLSKGLTKEQRRIANFWSDGPSTFTPPGHWNKIACDLAIKNQLNPLRTARVLAYMNQAVQDAGISCWDTKYHYSYPRPINVIDGFKTNLGTPNFPGYTSGHSSFSAAAAEVLGFLFPAEKQFLDSYAKEASDSRVYGGIHFRFDCTVGLETGKKAASATIFVAKADGAN
jgi:hypothetical protein